VAVASLLRRGGTASALLALAWSSQKLLLWNAGHGGHGSMPLSPTDGAKNVPAAGLKLRHLADLRISEDRPSWPRHASHAEPPTGGLVTMTLRSHRRTTGSVFRCLDEHNAFEAA
jgi:hypothetical protein